MRKAQREIKGRDQIEAILHKAVVLHLGMSWDDQPYVVPLNFVFTDGLIYLHCARVGHKMDFLRRNPRVCFTVSVDVEPIPGPTPCAWTCRYKSVIGFGRVVEVTDGEERRQGLMALVTRFAGENPGPLNEEALTRTCVLRIDIESMTGKHN